MTNTINMKLKLDDNGSIKDKVKDAEQLHQAFEKVEASARRVSKAAKSAEQRSGPSPTEITNYNRDRGSAGITGNASRDFAAQSQGLGGLVRLYATFAANIYATVAAFNALRQAANVEKMIEANQRFGETLGVNLRSVAKDLQLATAYSLSLQDSIKFANIGAAAGLAAKDIKNLTVIAKGAATALGRDVGESIQRIIQGTAKQEQEILDELGIFIKSKKAFEEYAAARNLKVDDLSASQRTLAYADAVAKAGEKWKQFADIDDPYGKLTASLQNTLNEVLTTINTVAKPLAAFFAENTNLILSFSALITSKLLNTALPDLKKGLLGLITFDNSRAKAAADVLRSSLTAEFNIAAKAANDATAQVKKLQDAMLSASKAGERTNLAKAFIIPSEAIGTRNSPGLNAPKIGAEFLSPKNMENIKTLQDAQNSILNVIRLQLAEEGKREVVLQGLIKNKVLEAGSTFDSLKLAEQGNIAAVNGLHLIERRKKEQLELNAAVQAEVQARNKAAAVGQELNKAGGAVQVVPAAAITSTAAVKTNVQAAAAAAASLGGNMSAAAGVAQVMAAKTLSLAGTWVAFRDTFVKTGDSLQNTLTTAAAKGPIGQFKDAFKVLGSTFSNAREAAAGVGAAAVEAGAKVSVFGKAAAAAGAGAATALGAVRLALGGIMAAMGPIMLAWTVWELAGPWIKKTFFNITKELEELEEQAKETAKTLQESYGIASKAIDRANIALSTPTSTTDELIKALEAKANAAATVIEALQKEREAQDKLRAYTPTGEAAKPYTLAANLGKDDAKAVKTLEDQLKLIKEFNLQGPDTQEFTEKLTRLQDQLARPDGTFSRGIKDQLIPSLIELGKRVVNIEDLNKAMEESRRQAGLLESVKTSLGTFDSFVSKNNLVQASEAKSAGFGKDTDAFKAYQDIKKASEKLREFRASGKSAEDASLTLANSIATIGKAATLAGVSTSGMTEVLEISNRIVALNSAISVANAEAKKAIAAGDTLLAKSYSAQAASMTRQSADLTAQLSNLTNGEMFKGVLVGLGAINKGVEEFSTKTRQLFKAQEQEIRAAEAALASYKAKLDLGDKLESFTTEFTRELNAGNRALQERISLIDQEFIIEEKKAALARDKVLMSSKTKKGSEEYKAAVDTYNTTVASLQVTKQAKTLSEELSAIERDRAEALRLSNEAYTLASTVNKNLYEVQADRAKLEQLYAENAYEVLGLTKEEISYENLLFEQQSKRLKLLQEEKELIDSINQQKKDVNTKADSAISANVAKRNSMSEYDPRAYAAIEAEINRINKEREEALQKIDANTKSTLDKLNDQKSILQETLEIEQRRAKLAAIQSAETKKTTTFGKALVGLFSGTQFEKQSKSVSNMLKVTQNAAQRLAQHDSDDIARKEKNTDTYLKLLKITEDTSVEGQKELAKLRSEHDAQDAKSNKERMEMQWEVATESINAAKQVFSEKTAAYRVLDGIERAMHAYKMAMMAAEMAMQVQQLAITLKNAVAETLGLAAPVAAKSANDTPGPWPVKLAAAVAALAFISSLAGGGGGGGGGAPVAGNSAADKQSTQGTGLSWLNGEKVENSKGVLGDPEAKSESIKNSLEIIADNTIEGLAYDSKMLMALQNIDKAIGTTAKSVYGVKGISSGSAFGNQQVSTSSSGIQGLFGSSTTREIVDSGIKISGMFTQLAKGLGQYTQYETIQNTRRRSGFLGIGGSTSVSYDTQTTALNSAVKDSIASIFSNATKLFEEVGSKVGVTLTDITTRLSGFNIDFEASLKGLTGKELEEALNAVISQALDGATSALFGQDFSKFQEFGEGLLETVVRVVDTNDKMKVALGSIGLTLGEFSFESSEALADLVGGIEEFTQQVREYRDTFLSESERLAQAQDTVTEKMAELRFSTVDTREEFKTLVAGLDLNTESGRTLYAELMKIAPAFALVTEKHQELIDEYTSLETEFLQTYKTSAEAKAELIRREEEGLSASAVAQLRRNKALQEEIDALNEYYSLSDELDQFVLTSTELRAKERAAIHESNLAIYDLVQAYKLRAEAESNMANALSEINSLFEQIESAAEQAAADLENATNALIEGYLAAEAALKSAEKSFESAKQGLISLFFEAKDALATATANVSTALDNITKRSISASATLKSEREKITAGFVNAQKSVNTALENITKGFINAQNSLQAASNNITAGYLAAKNKVEEARLGITNGFVSARTALQTSLKGITKGYLDAKKGVEQARAAIAAQEAANRKQLKDNLRNIGNTINDFISSLATSELSALNDASKFNALQGKFDELFAKAQTGDVKAAEQLQSVASELLTVGKGQLSTSEQYATLFAGVTDKLSIISKDYLDKAGPEDVNDGLSDLLSNLAEAESNFAKWEEAARVSGASLVEEQEDLLAEWKIASADFKVWNDARELSGAASELPTEDVAKTWKDAVADLVLWQKAVDESGAATVAATVDYAKEWRDAATELGKWQTAINDSGAATTLAEADFLDEWKTATNNLALWEKAVVDSGASRVLAETDLLAGYKDAWDAYSIALRAVETSGAPTELPEEEDPLIVALNNAVTAQTTALNNFATVSTTVQDILGGIPTSENRLNNFANKLQTAVDTYNTSYQELVTARTNMADWGDALGKAGLTLDDVKTHTKNSADSADKALAKYDAAKAAKELADKDLADARIITDGLISANKTAIDDLRAAVNAYNNNKSIFDTNDAIIRDTAVDSVKDAVIDSADLIVSAITAAEEPVVVVPDTPPPVNPEQPYTPIIRDDTGNTGIGGIGGGPGTTVPEFPYTESMFDYSAAYRYWMNAWDISGGPIIPPDITLPDYVVGAATGGYHSGGLRLVGENGPELEVTGPSRIFSASDTNNIISNLLNTGAQESLLRDVVRELQQVKSELAQITNISGKVESNTKKSKDILENVTQGGDTLRTEGV